MSSYFEKFKKYASDALNAVRHWSLRLFDLYEWTIRFITTLHQATTSLLITIAVIIPLVGLLIEALGLLASVVARVLYPPKEKPPNHIAIGLKVLTAGVMVGCAVVGFLFPPAGISLVVVGLSAGAMLQAYKLYRTSDKHRQAQSGNSQLPKKEDEYENKLKHRGISLALSCINIVLLVTTLVAPPSAIVTLPSLMAINFGTAVYQYFAHSSSNHSNPAPAPAPAPPPPGSVSSERDDSIITQDDTSEHNEESDSEMIHNDESVVYEAERSVVNDAEPSISIEHDNQLTVPLSASGSEEPISRNTSLSVKSWPSSVVFAVGAMYAFAGYFDITLVIAAVLLTSFKIPLRSTRSVANPNQSHQDHQPLTLPEVSDTFSSDHDELDVSSETPDELTQPIEDHQADRASIDRFLQTMDVRIPTTSTTYAQRHSHDNHPETSEETVTTTNPSRNIDQFLRDGTYVLTHHDHPLPVDARQNNEDQDDGSHAEEQVGM